MSVKRFLNIDDPQFTLLSINGIEQLSDLFHFELELSSENHGIKPLEYLGNNINFSIEGADQKKRYFNGFISRFTGGPIMEGGSRWYRIEVVPALWYLTQNQNSRVYEKATVKNVISDILDKSPEKIEYSFNVGKFEEREYCVQYKESDFNFLSRLLEEEGIYYFFEHKNGSHKLHLCDKNTGYIDCVEHDVKQSYTNLLDDHVSDWSDGAYYHGGGWEVESYDFEKVELLTTETKDTCLNHSISKKLRKYEPYSRRISKSETAHISTVRMECEEAGQEISQGVSSYRSFTSGGKFKFVYHDIKDIEGKEYVITQITHSVSEGSGYNSDSTGLNYRNSFSCIPANVLFRPQQIVSKPKIDGILTGTVTSESKDGPTIDKYGRVKIQLHWEAGKRDKVSKECWVRVAQASAGNKWGSFVVPDKGQEVIVSFVDGNPDSPLITGSLYNGKNAIPFNKADESATQFGLRTSNGNEFIVDNKKGKEKISFLSKFDYETIIENNEVKKIKNDRSFKITDGDETIDIEKGKRTTTIKGDDSNTIKSGDYTLDVSSGDFSTKIASGKGEMEAAKSFEIKVGANSIKIDTSSILLKTPTSEIKIDSNGITAKGMKVGIKGELEAKLESNLKTEVKGAVMTSLGGGVMTEVKGSGIVKVQGSLTTIN